MKLYLYDDIRKLNQAIGSFNHNGTPVTKVEVLAVVDKLQFFVLTDPKEDYLPKPKVESKTEDEIKKNLKVKKEKKEEITPTVPNKKPGTVIEGEKVETVPLKQSLLA